ncbi:MAG: outer membrane protein transport protein [Acidobacteriota bacterium]|nr:outer membrane protein transport protein [Acidobacteriota bacterium]
MKRLFMILLLMTGSLVYAQHNNRTAQDLQFRFSNPGARSLGFGGAFIGLADDATAPVANPAGMVRTSKRSLSLELNVNRRDNEIPFAGGDIIQTNLFEFDFNLQETSAPETLFGAPYGAVVFPVGKWRLALFAHQQANLERSYSTDQINICQISDNDYPDCEVTEESFGPGNDVVDMQIWNLGGSAAYAFNDNFSMGLSLFTSELDYQADSVVDVIRPTRTVQVSKLAGGTDTDFGGIFGALWRITEDLSVGVTYKFQPEFTYTAELAKSGPLSNTRDDFVTDALFKIPDSFAIGFSINPVDAATLNLDANRVYYSQITDELLDFSAAETQDGAITQSIGDVTEIHVGFEWIFLNMANPLSLRLGYWLDPYHAPISNVSDSQILGGPVTDAFARDIFFLQRFEEDENHYALGLGWTFGEKLQLDMAYEYGEKSSNGTVSGIYRF